MYTVVTKTMKRRYLRNCTRYTDGIDIRIIAIPKFIFHTYMGSKCSGFDAFEEKLYFLAAILDFMPYKKCSTLTSWHTSYMKSEPSNWPKSIKNIIHCVHEKRHALKFSKLASFAQLQYNSMNIYLLSIKMPILVKICPTIIEILTFNKWS